MSSSPTDVLFNELTGGQVGEWATRERGIRSAASAAFALLLLVTAPFLMASECGGGAPDSIMGGRVAAPGNAAQPLRTEGNRRPLGWFRVGGPRR